MKQQIHQLAAAAAAAASAYPAALAQLAAASSGAFSPDFAAASALAAVSLVCPQWNWFAALKVLQRLHALDCPQGLAALSLSYQQKQTRPASGYAIDVLSE